jgi:LysM repeat protein
MAAREVYPMLRIQGLQSLSEMSGRMRSAGFLLVVSLAASGCSTDFRRLENPSMGLGEKSPLPTATLNTRRNAGAPIATEAWNESGPRAPLPPVTSNPRPAFDNGPPPQTNATAGLSKPFDRPKPALPAAPSAGAKPPIAPGETVEVQAGDSLYAISKRHNVSIAALMDVNQLKSPNLKPGQKIVLPASGGVKRPIAKTVGTQVASAGTALPPSAVASPAPAVASPAPSGVTDWSGTYTLKPGDSLFAIARTHKVTLAELTSRNSIADATKMRPGTVLKVPGNVQTASAPATPEAPRASQIGVGASAPVATTVAVAPKLINVQPPAGSKDEPTGTVAPVAPQAPAPTPPIASAPATTKPAPVQTSAGAAGKFQWPVKGPILSSFGKRPDGSPNDGVSISAPTGTSVLAAQDGTIAYAGSELKGYGNLILAKAGQSGGVDKPQVHFELRKDSKPIDPTPHMEKM